MNRYANRTGPVAPSRGPSIDPEIPVTGTFRVRMHRDGPPCAVRIWLGPPIDPDTGEEMSERGYRWQAIRNGAPVDVLDIWPGCARDPIDRAEHDRLVSLARTMEEDSPFFDVRRPVDLRNCPVPF